MSERISPDELEALQAEEAPIVVDVRPQERYAAGHIPGAHHIPLREIEQRLSELPKEKLIVTYCGGGTSCATAADILAQHGYRVRVMQGFRAWEAAGKPVARGVEGTESD